MLITEAEHQNALPLLTVVAVALVDPDGRVLLGCRPEGRDFAGYWEFPGGKIEQGETPEVALIRELREELGIETKDSCLAPLGFSSHRYQDKHLILLVYICRKWTGRPQALEGGDIKWVRPQQMRDYQMPPANRDIIPLLLDLL